MNIKEELIKIASDLKEYKVIDIRKIWKEFMKKMKSDKLNPKDIEDFITNLVMKLSNDNICKLIKTTDINTWNQMIENIKQLDIQDYEPKFFDDYFRIINEIAHDNGLIIQTF